MEMKWSVVSVEVVSLITYSNCVREVRSTRT